MKVASLSSFREAQLIKTASAEDSHLYSEMCKLADTGDELQIRMFLAQHPEMEKDAGIIGHGFRILSKALGKGGAMTGSAKMTQMAGQAAKKSQARFAQAATKSEGRVVAMEEGLRGASGGRLTKEMAKADKFKALAGQQKTWATTHGQAAGKQIAANAKAAPVPVPAPAAAAPLVSNSTLGKAIVGTAAVGGVGAVGYGGYKGVQRGKAQNLQQQARGFNYGM